MEASFLGMDKCKHDLRSFTLGGDFKCCKCGKIFHATPYGIQPTKENVKKKQAKDKEDV